MSVDNILTVDVEDWFHICGVDELLPQSSWPRLETRVADNTLRILDILSKKKVKATFFVLGFIAERHPQLVRDIYKERHEIAIHGYAHRRAYDMDPESFREDVRKAKEIVSNLVGHLPKGYRAAEWSIRHDSLWALDILHEEGFEYDSSMAPLAVVGDQDYPTTPHKRTLVHGHIWEFPPFVGKMPFYNFPLAGGWGLRILPYQFIRYHIKKLNNRGQPAVMFIHPREFDKKNPRIPLPLAKRFVLGARIEKTEKRLNRLLNDFQFISFSEFLKKKVPS